jgi:hypothetical protein
MRPRTADVLQTAIHERLRRPTMDCTNPTKRLVLPVGAAAPARLVHDNTEIPHRCRAT